MSINWAEIQIVSITNCQYNDIFFTSLRGSLYRESFVIPIEYKIQNKKKQYNTKAVLILNTKHCKLSNTKNVIILNTKKLIYWIQKSNFLKIRNQIFCNKRDISGFFYFLSINQSLPTRSYLSQTVTALKMPVYLYFDFYFFSLHHRLRLLRLLLRPGKKVFTC